MNTIDTAELKKFDIAAVIQRDLGPAQAQHGVHLYWKCPFHDDHTPSLDVNRNLNRVFCNPCGLALDPAGWVMKYSKVGFVAAAKQLLGEALPTVTVEPAEAQPESAPGPEWQKRAMAIVTYGMQQLSAHPAAQRYLADRGLHALTLQTWKLGYNPRGQRIAGLYVDPGILIPDLHAGEFWGIKIRLLPGHPIRCLACGVDLAGPGACPSCGKVAKYRGVRGNVGNLYGRYQERRVVFLCEGEFDAMLAWQCADELGGVATTTAGAGKKWNTAWSQRLLDAEKVVVLYDMDGAGQRGAAKLAELGQRVHVARVPHGKDVTEYAQAGGNIYTWLRNVRNEALAAADPEQVRRQASNRSLPPALRADYYADALGL